MVRIRPFSPFLFSDEIEDVISPPFDSISREMEHDLKEKQHNITHLTLPDLGSDPGVLISRWISDGTLKRKPGCHYVILDQSYSLASGEERLTGIIALANVFPDDGSIRPHEKTFPKPIKERIRIMKSASAQLEPVFLFVDSADLETRLRHIIAERRPDIHFVDRSGVRNRVYFIDVLTLVEVASMIESLPGVVADGHHRTAASRELALQSTGAEREFWSWIMAYIVPLRSTGLKIYGIHRYVHTSNMKSRLVNWNGEYLHTDHGRTDGKLLTIYDGRWHSISPTEMACSRDYEACLSPVHTLNRLILQFGFGFSDEDFQERVSYTHSEEEAIHRVDSGQAEFAAILPQWDKGSLMRLILERGFLPQKSTYFYPKPPSGLFINALRQDA